MSKLADFVVTHLGVATDVDGAFGAQCVDLVQAWADAVGMPRFSGNAIDLADQPNPGATWIPAGQGLPLPGDVVVWGETDSLGIGPLGHTDIVVDGVTVTGFRGLDQNWFDSSPDHGSPAAFVHHDYRGVLGWHHFKALDPAPIPTPEEDDMPNEVPGPHFPSVGPFDSKHPLTLFNGVNTRADRVYVRVRNDNPDPTGAFVSGQLVLVSDEGPVEAFQPSFTLAPSKTEEWQLPLDLVGDLILQSVSGPISVSVKFGKR